MEGLTLAVKGPFGMPAVFIVFFFAFLFLPFEGPHSLYTLLAFSGRPFFFYLRSFLFSPRRSFHTHISSFSLWICCSFLPWSVPSPPSSYLRQQLRCPSHAPLCRPSKGLAISVQLTRRKARSSSHLQRVLRKKVQSLHQGAH